MSPRQSLLYRAETGLCIHSVTCQVESLHPAADHTKSRIIKIDICVIQISFRIQFVCSMAAYYIQPHIACSYFHQPPSPHPSYYHPLRRLATANRSLSLPLPSLTSPLSPLSPLSYQGKNLSLVEFILLPHSPCFFARMQTFYRLANVRLPGIV